MRKTNVDQMLNLFYEARKLYSKREKEDAKKKYSQALDLNQNFIIARLERGKMNFGLDYEQALFDFEEVLKQDPKNIKALKGIAISLKMKGNYEEALYYAQKGLKKNQTSPQLNFHLADCNKFIGKNQEALYYINRAIEQKKNKYEKKLKVYYQNKAEIYLGLNDFGNAKCFIEEALKIDQNYESARIIEKRIDEKQLANIS
ncbi:unnamed protein product [Paramecium sonneborni]|uniref:Tetratricopeptide repeat protein 21A/21B fifth ARM repeats domain-containing protein n=1 Tax=Paramecium sonneborni TaxID=65129 RepID=A0A8S1RF31_9CILI|nr:unnamed protein product [Paramecium sonneborni]